MEGVDNSIEEIPIFGTIGGHLVRLSLYSVSLLDDFVLVV
jgi:hypothetical protein